MKKLLLLLLTIVTATVTDIDGNVYEIVQIGDQLWMAENLKVTHYNNGDEILNITNHTEWINHTGGAYAEYENSIDIELFGNLYNGYTLNDDRGVCPDGWHLPTDQEWKNLELFLGMSEQDLDLEGPVDRGGNQGSKLAGMLNYGKMVY